MTPGFPGPPPERVAAFFQKHRTGLVTIVFTDLVDSTALLHQLGDQAGTTFLRQRRQLLREILRTLPEAEEIETAGDSFLLVFTKPSDAVRFALLSQARLRTFSVQSHLSVQERMGIHLGEVVISEHETEVKAKDLYGIQLATCARVMSLAKGGQILLTRGVFDSARQVLKGEDIQGIGPLEWLNHGPYSLKGIEEPVEVCEVRETGQEKAPGPPTSSEKAQRQVRADEEPVLGWRPAIGQLVPNTQWVIEQKLGEGGFGEVWLGRHQTMKERRVFKFCFRSDRVRSLKREMTLFRLIKERIGDHPNIVALREVYFEQPPFYVEEDYVAGDNLANWCESQGGVDKVPLEVKLEIVAQIADALQAAHDAGVIHRDVKPANILVGGQRAEVGNPKSEFQNPISVEVKLTDFGIGQVVSEEYLTGVTRAGFTQTMFSSSSSQTGTQLYMAPELLAGKPASIRSDIYSLGVVLYQLLVGDFTRPVTTDWANDLTEPLLREDLKLCFAGRPEDRFAGAVQLANSLRALPERQAELVRRQAEEAEHEHLRRQAERRHRQFLVTGVVAAILVGLAMALGYGLRKAERARQAEAREAYYSSIGLASAYIEKGDIDLAHETLLKCPAEYRHWEWGRLMYLCYEDVLSFPAHAAGPRLIRFSPQSDRLTSLGPDGSLKVWNSTNAALVFSYASTSNPANVFAWRPDGQHLATGMSNHLVRVWDTKTWQEVWTLRGHTNPLKHVAYAPAAALSVAPNPDSARNPGPEAVLLATAGANGPVKVWNASSGQERYTLANHPRPVTELAFSLDSQRLIVKSATSVAFYRAIDGTQIPSSAPSRTELSLFVDPRGQVLVTIDDRGRLELRPGMTNAIPLGRIIGKLQPEIVWNVFFSPDGTKFCTGGEEGTARVWDTASGQELFSIPSRVVHVPVFSPDGSGLATLGAEKAVHLWDLSSGRELRVLRGHATLVRAATFSPDGRLIATGSEDGMVKVWSAQAGRELLVDEPDDEKSRRLGQFGRATHLRRFDGDWIRRLGCGNRPDARQGDHRPTRGSRFCVQPRWSACGHRRPRQSRASVGRGNGAAPVGLGRAHPPGLGG
jgi:WD40 repeat protein/class 3 adenylate cyclase